MLPTDVAQLTQSWMLCKILFKIISDQGSELFRLPQVELKLWSLNARVPMSGPNDYLGQGTQRD